LTGKKNFLNKACRYLYCFFFLPVLFGALVFHGSGAALEGGHFSQADMGLLSAIASRQVAVHMNGVPLQFDLAPRIEEGSPVFPLRRIFEEMGYGVNWEGDNKRIVLTGWGRHIVLYPQNPLYAINGIVYRMARPPFLEKGRLMVGLDFIQQAAGVSELFWDEAQDLFEIRFKEEGRLWKAEDAAKEGFSGKYPTWFLEVLLPEENRVGVGESFEIVIGAPFVRGIHSYEVRFFFNPELIKIKDIKNPSYRQAEEFYLKRINNREGVVEYTLTNLGFAADIPPRRTLVVMEAVAFREGAVPLIGGTLHVELQDNTATRIPTAVEEKTLQIRSSR
jgi:hypothetical protein